MAAVTYKLRTVIKSSVYVFSYFCLILEVLHLSFKAVKIAKTKCRYEFVVNVMTAMRMSVP